MVTPLRVFRAKISHFSPPPYILRIRPPRTISFIFLLQLRRITLLGSCSSQITLKQWLQALGRTLNMGWARPQHSVYVISLPRLLQPVTNGARLWSGKTIEEKRNFHLQASFYVIHIVPRLQRSLLIMTHWGWHLCAETCSTWYMSQTVYHTMHMTYWSGQASCFAKKIYTQNINSSETLVPTTKIYGVTWYCMERVSPCNIYVIQQDTQCFIIDFIHNTWWLDMFRTSMVHPQEHLKAVCCKFGMWCFAYYSLRPCVMQL